MLVHSWLSPQPIQYTFSYIYLYFTQILVCMEQPTSPSDRDHQNQYHLLRFNYHYPPYSSITTNLPYLIYLQAHQGHKSHLCSIFDSHSSQIYCYLSIIACQSNIDNTFVKYHDNTSGQDMYNHPRSLLFYKYLNRYGTAFKHQPQLSSHHRHITLGSTHLDLRLSLE